MSYTPNFSDIEEAFSRIEPYIHITPILTCNTINELTGTQIYFKCENFQKVGAFKFRGATNAVFNLTEEKLANGVIAHSSGNHAAALALAAKIRGTKAHIVMPENAPEIKKQAVAGYGAEITFCEATLEARENTTAKIISETGAHLIHPYQEPDVIAGQGTCALELMSQQEDLDAIISPVGGGGLISGTAIAAKHLNPDIEIIGAEPKGADDAYRSIEKGELLPSINPQTIADGLLTSLGEINYQIIREKVDAIFTCEESSIIEAMRLIWERMKIIVEPSSAVPLAIILENKDIFRGKKLGVILSGGNVDLTNLPF